MTEELIGGALSNPANESQALVTEKDWSAIDGEVWRVVEFTPLAKVENGKVIATNAALPYALVTLRSPLYPEIVGGIGHKIDFLNLWTAFVDRGVSEGEEVNIAWTKSNLKWPAKLFARFMPGLAVMICKAGFNDHLNDPDCTSELSWQDQLPLVHLVPDVLK